MLDLLGSLAAPVAGAVGGAVSGALSGARSGAQSAVAASAWTSPVTRAATAPLRAPAQVTARFGVQVGALARSAGASALLAAAEGMTRLATLLEIDPPVRHSITTVSRMALPAPRLTPTSITLPGSFADTGRTPSTADGASSSPAPSPGASAVTAEQSQDGAPTAYDIALGRALQDGRTADADLLRAVARDGLSAVALWDPATSALTDDDIDAALVQSTQPA